MITEHSFENVKKQVAAIGDRLGSTIAQANLPRHVKQAWFSILPHADVDALVAPHDEHNKVATLLSLARDGKIKAGIDESTIDMVLKQYLLKHAFIHQGVVDDEIGADEATHILKNFHGAAMRDVEEVNPSTLVQHVAPTFIRAPVEEQTHHFWELQAVALGMKPPTHAWQGPQPGLFSQTDTQHRYVFSEKTGRLEYVVKYAETGQPHMRVNYKHAAADGSKAYPHTIDVWHNGDFLPAGAVDAAAPEHAGMPQYMVDAEGTEHEIPQDDTTIFITPAGAVVRLVSAGTWLRAPRAAYVGRLAKFDPMKPFLMKTPYGTVPVQQERSDILIDPKGGVHEVTGKGLRYVGEITFEEHAALPHDAPPFTASNDFFVAYLAPHPEGPRFSMDLVHPTVKRVVDGPLHMLVGRHAFMQPTVPELVDMHGGNAAETKLRALEQHAIELGLVLYTLNQETRPEPRAALMRLHYLMEERLWLDVAALEDLVGMEHHTLIHPPSIRLWLERCAQDPVAAVMDLKKSATPFRYAP